MKNIVVFYHKDCPDGFGSAWAIYKKLGKKTEYIGVERSSNFPKNLKNKKVYLVDYSWSEPTMKKLLKENPDITIIDHHLSAREILKLVPCYSYDVNHSAAVLTWRYFHPGKAVPKLLSHIEDRDIWKFKLPLTRELTASLDTYDFDFKIWDKIALEIQNPNKRKKYIEEGKAILKYQEKIIKRLVKKADKARFAGKKVLVINSPVLHSEIGNALVKEGYPIGIVWSWQKNKKRVSLRSDGKTNVAEIAENFGGGGHKAAAGFFLNAQKPFPWKII